MTPAEIKAELGLTMISDPCMRILVDRIKSGENDPRRTASLYRLSVEDVKNIAALAS